MERARTIRQRDYRSHHSPYRHLVRAAILLDAWLLRSARTIAGRRWHFLLCSRLFCSTPLLPRPMPRYWANTWHSGLLLAAPAGPLPRCTNPPCHCTTGGWAGLRRIIPWSEKGAGAACTCAGLQSKRGCRRDARQGDSCWLALKLRAAPPPPCPSWHYRARQGTPLLPRPTPHY